MWAGDLITFGGAVEGDVVDAADEAVVLDVRLDGLLPITQLCEVERQPGK